MYDICQVAIRIYFRIRKIFEENIPTKDIIIEHKSSNNRNANVLKKKKKKYFRKVKNISGEKKMQKRNDD